MKQARSKKFLALMLSILMVTAIIPLSSFTAFAAGEVTGVDFTQSYVEIPLDSTVTITATVSPSNATDKTVEYDSSDYNIAVVNPKTGEITARKEGTVTITATTKDGGFTDTVTVKILKNVSSQIMVNFYTESNAQTTFDSQVIASGNKVLRPATNPTKEGYVFGGWYEDTNYSNVWDFDTETVTRSFMSGNSSRKSLYARWIAQNAYKAVTSVTLDKTEIKADLAGGTFSETIKATVAPQDAQNKQLSWKSSDESVVSVAKKVAGSNEAIITFNKAGTATVTVTTEDGAKTATCTVTLTDTRTIALDKTAIEADLASGTFTYKLSATVTPGDSAIKDLTWVSSDESVATVRASKGNTATVTVHKAGTATITAEDAGKSATCTITATDTRALKLDKTEVKADLADGVFSYELSASITPETATINNLKWTSSDETIATVTAGRNNKATVTVKKAGNFTITAEDTGKTVSCAFAITDSRTLTLSSSKITSNFKGENISYKITAVVAPNKTAVNDIKWSSSDTSVVTVQKTSATEATVTVRKAGTATITAEDAGKTASCEIISIDALISALELKITPPIAAQAPSTSTTVSDDRVTVKSIKWPENVTTFAEGQTYTVTIALEAKEGFTFPSITTRNYSSIKKNFKINGNEVASITDYAEGQEDTTISVTYSFRAVAAHTHTYGDIINGYDDTHHFKECINIDCPDPFKGATEKALHTPSTEFSHDAKNHWNECSCGYKANFEAHKPAEDDGNCLTAVNCSVCSVVITEAKEAHADRGNDGKCDFCEHDMNAESETTAPETEAPATDAPATDAPATDAPATDAPATEATSDTDSTDESKADETNGAEGTDTEEDETTESEDSTDETAEDATDTDTDAESDTETAADATDTNAATSADDKEEVGCDGCDSSASISALAIASIIGTAVVIKKKED